VGCVWNCQTTLKNELQHEGLTKGLRKGCFVFGSGHAFRANPELIRAPGLKTT